MEGIFVNRKNIDLKYTMFLGLGVLSSLLHVSYIVFTLFIVLTYLYLKSEKAAYCYLGAFFITFAIRDFLYAYYLSLIVCFYLLFIQCLRLWNKNLYHYLPIMSAILIVPFTYHYLKMNAIYLSIITMFLIYEIFKKQDQYLNIILTFFTFLVVLMSSQTLIIHLYLGILCFILDLKYSVLFIILSSLLGYNISDYSLFYMLLFVFKHQSFFYLMIPFSFLLLPNSIESIVLIISMILLNYWYKPKQQCHHPLNSTQQYMSRKLQCYSGIFESLAKYYQYDQPQASFVLHSLSKTLDDDVFHRLHQRQQDYIRNCLESYYFKVEQVEVEKQRIRLQVKQVRKSEIVETIVPLLENLLQKSFLLTSLKYNGYYLGYEFELVYELPYTVESVGDSISNVIQENGDIYSIFQFRDNYITMICDGMGNGKRAYESAKLVSSLFQKFIVSGMLCEEAIRCINQLVQSECFSTLDVLFFNPSKQKAYLLKSAACPTYLIRNDELMILEGNALPLGIMEQVEVDCKEIDMQEDDLFLLVSDGVYENEVKKWSKKTRKLTLNQEKECLLRILNKESRLDDTTFVISKVIKNDPKKQE